ncbi:MAG: Translation initiation factor IF-2 [Candidatus Westeberhardia cardiocondylae]|nr:Translation initiation factor IF-2 [Candidatus Westeberhardia cardiocondylae]
MKNITVKLLSYEINVSIDRLLQHFLKIGIHKTEMDYVTQKERDVLLLYLQREQDVCVNKLVVQRKKRKMLSVFSANGKNKSVQIEIRRKKTYYQNNTNINKEVVLENKSFASGICNDFSNNNIKKYVGKVDKKYYSSKDYKSVKDKKNKVSTGEIYKGKYIKKVKNNITRNKIRWNKIPILKDKNFIKILDCNKNYFSSINNDYNIDKDYKKSFHGKKKYIQKNQLDSSVLSHIDRQDKCTSESYSTDDNYSRCTYKEIDISLSKNIRVNKAQSKRKVVIDNNFITISDLSNKIFVKVSRVINILEELKVVVNNVDQIIDNKLASLIAEKFGYQIIFRDRNFLENSVMLQRNKNIVNIIPEVRAPVVAMMGHVDHGKTSLLDYIRSEKTVLKEVGGITQSIGAYHVSTVDGMMTFIDTPGHEVFREMRMRGIKITDIVVLVIAADDGLMPQTIESIQYAKDAKIPIIVAINKIDKITNNVDKIKKELVKYEILSEDWGGENQFVYVSAKFGTGVDDLLHSIAVQAEIMELKVAHNCMASGIVLESSLKRDLGPIATILITEGTMKQGDVLLCGTSYGRVRLMQNEWGNNIVSAGPSMPVEICGLSDVPIIGDTAIVLENEKYAKKIALYRRDKCKEIKLNNFNMISLKDAFVNINQDKKKYVYNIVLKSDTYGSLEAISSSLKNLTTKQVQIKFIHSGVGDITENDVIAASTFHAKLFGFNVRVSSIVRKILFKEHVDVRVYSIIYNLIDDIKKEISKNFLLKYNEKIIGLAEVRDIFRSFVSGIVLGCVVQKGLLKRSSNMYILREKRIIYEGKLESLRRFKRDVEEVHCGMECGIGIKNFRDVCVGDVVRVFDILNTSA